jgi:hypothetical protein
VKVTVPVGLPVAGEAGVTVAVYVICCPRPEGLDDDAIAVADAIGTMLSVNIDETDVPKVVSPEYVAAIQ